MSNIVLIMHPGALRSVVKSDSSLKTHPTTPILTRKRDLKALAKDAENFLHEERNNTVLDLAASVGEINQDAQNEEQVHHKEILNCYRDIESQLVSAWIRRIEEFKRANPDWNEAGYHMKRTISEDLSSNYLEEPRKSWQASDIREMTGTSSKNWLFSKESPINTLILDAHITVHHLNVQKYASEKVWEAGEKEWQRKSAVR